MEAIFFAFVLFSAFVLLAGGFFYGTVRSFWGPSKARWAALIVVGFLLALGIAVGWWVGKMS